MVGYKWRGFQIIKKGVSVYGMEFWKEWSVGGWRGVYSVESLVKTVKDLIEVTGKKRRAR